MTHQAEEARDRGLTRAEFLGQLVPGVHSQEETAWLWKATEKIWKLKKNPPVAVFANPGRKKKEPEGFSESSAWKYVAEEMRIIRQMLDNNSIRAAEERLRGILQVAESMLAQVRAGVHKNPATIPLLGRDRNRIGGERMSNRVLAVEYQHKEDGKEYRHDFRPGVQMIAEADGNIRLQHSKPGHSLWEDM